MLMLLALPIVALVAALERQVRCYAPSNQVVRVLRSRQIGWRTVAALMALAAACLLGAHMLTSAGARRAPGWVNLIALVLVFDAAKFGLESMRMVAAAVRTRN